MGIDEYLVIGWGYSKTTGEPFSRCAKIVNDRSGNNKYQFLDLDSSHIEYTNDIREIGSIVTISKTYS